MAHGTSLAGEMLYKDPRMVLAVLAHGMMILAGEKTA